MTKQLALEMNAKKRRPEVLRMYLEGIPVTEIAAKYAVSRQTIYDDFQTARREWQQTKIENVGELVELHIAQLEHVIREAYRGWHRSLEDSVTLADTAGEDPKTTRTVKGQSGNPAFLDTIIKAVTKICELRGLLGKDREAREQAETQVTPMLGVIVSTREEAEMMRRVRSLTLEGGALKINHHPLAEAVPAKANGHAHSNGDDDAD